MTEPRAPYTAPPPPLQAGDVVVFRRDPGARYRVACVLCSGQVCLADDAGATRLQGIDPSELVPAS